jgi:NAD(P)-dependent dehydrogenase (short-subunit alcohol dehydrogenase family)
MAFKDKIIFITGAGSGFGQALARALDEHEANLCLCDIDDTSLQNTLASLKHPSNHLTQCFDVSYENSFKDAINACINHFKRLDILVNNAGVGGKPKPIIEITDADLDRYFAINSKSVLFGMKYAIPQMIKQGEGSILNVASMAGLIGSPTLGAYSASKHAVVGLTKTAALEYAKMGIRVNAICPYFVPTPLVTQMREDAKMAAIEKMNPMGRMGRVEEIVTAMLSIIHPANTYMNGQTIQVDGGIGA